jgi:hypothetical protein
MKEEEKRPITLGGTFTLPFNDTELPGRLVIDDDASLLEVAGKGHVTVHGEIEGIYGTLTDHKLVSLLQCVPYGSTHSAAASGDKSFTARYFPHFVVRGKKHLKPNDAVIRCVNYRFDAASILFKDHTNFGSLWMDASEFNGFISTYGEKHHIENVSADDAQGPAALHFFSGRTEIASCETKVGKLNVLQFPHQAGARITIRLEFQTPLKLNDALRNLFDVHQFLELLLGQRQAFAEVELNLSPDETGTQTRLDLYGAMFADRTARQARSRKPSNYDVLIDAVRDRAQFEKVASTWIARQAVLKEARGRFGAAFYSGLTFGHDRLIGAANAFDILPKAFSPTEEVLTSSESAAISASMKIFDALDAGTLKARAIQNLGLLGKPNLATKIKHRAALIKALKPEKFAELDFVCQQAAKCRNFYVHGGKPAFDYQEQFDAFAFLIRTLEFVFAASDLIECGWDFTGWSSHGTSMAHEFGAYIASYSHGLALLKSLTVDKVPT